MKRWLIVLGLGVALIVYGFIDSSSTVGASIGPWWLVFAPGILTIIIASMGIYFSRSRSK